MPTPTTPARGEPRRATLRGAAREWRRRPRLAVLAIGALVVEQAFSVGFAFSLKAVIDDITTHAARDRLAVLLAVLAGGFVLAAVATIVGERATSRAAATVTNDLRRLLYSHVLRLSPAYLMETSAAKINTRFTNNLRSLEGGYIQGFLDTVTLVIGALIAIPLLVFLDWRLTAITVVTLPLVIVVANHALPQYVASNDATSASEFNIVRAVEDTVRAHDVVRVFHLDSVLADRFEGLLDGHERRVVTGRSVAARVGKGASLGVLLVQVVIVVIGAELGLHDKLSAASLVGFVTILGLLTSNVYNFVRTDLPLLAEAGRGRRGLDDLLAAPVVASDPAIPAHLDTDVHDLSVDHVTFTYPSGSQPAIEDLSVQIPAGSKVSIVGANGSGKSTLLRLLVRLYDPQQGEIRLDDTDIRAISQQSFRRQIGVVLQGNFIFNDTIRENIRIALPDATDDDIIQAAELADLAEFVDRLPDGYDTVVGEVGGRLSGGQQQRLAIARALVREPSILLLDEVTTALDPMTESRINETLERASIGRTVIATTHRLAGAADADQILVMDGGRLVEHGRHDDLLAQDGSYRQLWNKQSGFAVRGDGRQATVDAPRLRHITLFADLTIDALASIARNLGSEYYEADQVVFNEGDPGDRFYLIARGRVSVLTFGASGEHLLDTLSDGDHFGELALLQDRPRTATIRTTTPSVFLTMDRAAFLDLVANTPEMAPALEERIIRSELALGEWRRLLGDRS